MASGKIHNSFNCFVITVFVVIIYYITKDLNYISDIMLFSAFFVVGTFYLSPDLDLENTKPFNNFGKLKVFVIPYSNFMIHRGRSLFNPRKWSHKTILGTLSRLIYFLSIITIIILTIATITIYLKYNSRNAKIEYINFKIFSFYKTYLNVILNLSVNLKKEILTSYAGIEASAQCHYYLDFKK